MAQELPVFDIVETLDDHDEVTSSYLRPTSTFDAKIQQIIEAQIEEEEKEKENQTISKSNTKKTKRQLREEKIKEINETYFKDEEELTETKTPDAQRHISNDGNGNNNRNFSNSTFQLKGKKNKKSVRFNDNKLEEVKSIENRFANMRISEDIVNQDLSKMTFAEFRRGFLLNNIDDKKNRNNSQKIEILPVENQDISKDSGKGLYDILEERKRNNNNNKEPQTTKSLNLQNEISQITKETVISSLPRRKTSKFKRDLQSNANDSERVQILKKRSPGAISQIAGKKGNTKDLSSLKSLSKKPTKKKTGTVKIAKPELKPYFLQDVQPNTLGKPHRVNKYDGGDERERQYRSIVEIVNSGPESALTISEINLGNDEDKVSDTHTQEASTENDTKFQENEPDNDNQEDDEQPVKETEYPVTKVDYHSLNNDIDGMVSAYMMGMYDDDVGIEYDMPNSIIEHEQDLEKYNMQVELIERELAKEREKEKSKKQSGPSDVNIPQKDNTGNSQKSVEKDDEEEVDNQPLLSDQIVEREVAVAIDDFETRLNDYEIIEESDSDSDDYSFNPEVINQEIAKTYQNLRQYLINKDSGFAREKEQEIEPIDEFGNPVKLSRFKAAQIRPYVDGL